MSGAGSGRPGRAPIPSASARPADKALLALAELRRRAREEAEQALVTAVRAASDADSAFAHAEAVRAANAARAASVLAEARQGARLGHELAALDGLVRAARQDAARDAQRVADADAARAEAAGAVATAKQSLASAQADEEAVARRLNAALALARAQRFAREDDEADERSGRPKNAPG